MWYDQARMLWPFDSNRCSLAFSFMEFREGSLLPNQFVLHFIANFHRVAESVPVLIRQTIDSVNDGGLHSEMWAINIDRHVEPSHIVSALVPGVFWTAYPERVHVYPRRSGQRIALGDSFDLTLHTHERFNILLFLLRDTTYDGGDIEPETASLLQIRRYHEDRDCFEEICQALLHSDAEDDLETDDISNLRRDIRIDSITQDGQCDLVRTLPIAHEQPSLQKDISEYTAYVVAPQLSKDDLETEDNWNHRRDIPKGSRYQDAQFGLFQELPVDKEVQFLQKIVHESLAPARVSQITDAPVTINLEAVLPLKDPTLTNDDEPSFQLFTRRNWYDFAIRQDGPTLAPLPDGLTVKPSSYHALTAVRDWAAVPCTYLVFVDGSSNGTLASWSFVVIATDGWAQSFVGCSFGTVQLDASDDHWYGADGADKISGELTALLMAQNWIFKQPSHVKAVLCPDLLLSKSIAKFQVLAKTHPILVRLARLQAEWIEDRTQYVHVKGHDSHAWNELADSLAAFALKFSSSSQDAPIIDLHLLAVNPDELKWTWMQDSTAPVAPCFPPFIDEQAVAFPLSCRRVSTGITPATQVEDCRKFQCKAITANVLALDPRNECQQVGRCNSERTMRLDHQWHELGAHLIGLQETRTDAGRFQSDHFHILASGADRSHTATLGCELWFHKSLSICSDGSEDEIKLADCNPTVQHADPRRLFVRFEVPGRPFCVVVLHAPCRHPDNGEGSQTGCDWWDQTSMLLHSMLRANTPSF